MRLVPALLLACSVVLSAKNSADPVASMQRKLDYLERNASARPPDPKPSIFTEAEINAYIASENIDLPQGVKSVRLMEQTDVVTGHARVDFDQIKAGQRSMNPLLAVFSGVHDVLVVAQAHGANGKGFVHVDSVSLDDVEIPHFVLQLFVDKYLRPKYPGLGIDSQFELPDRIDSAKVGDHTLSVIQK